MGERFPNLSTSLIPEILESELSEKIIAPELLPGADIAMHQSELGTPAEGRRAAEAKVREIRGKETMPEMPLHEIVGQLGTRLTYYRGYELTHPAPQSEKEDYRLAA